MSKTKKICLNGIGIALFVSLSMCLRVPVFENYYLCLGYVVMAVYCNSIGVISGTFVGVTGTILYCILINGLRGMPGWALGNIFIGICLGLGFKFAEAINGKIKKSLLVIISILIGTASGILIVKSITEVVLYAQPFVIRLTNNIYAFVADVVVLIIAIPICYILQPHLKKIINN